MIFWSPCFLYKFLSATTNVSTVLSVICLYLYLSDFTDLLVMLLLSLLICWVYTFSSLSVKIKKKINCFQTNLNHISGAIISMFTLRVDFEGYIIGIRCFSWKHTALSSKRKDCWLWIRIYVRVEPHVYLRSVVSLI